MKSRTTRLLLIGLIAVSILCVVIFSFLAIFMNSQNVATMNEVGTVYMAGMSNQISMHFETTMDLRLSQVEALVDTIKDKSISDDALHQMLVYNARARGFEYLALYSANGTFETVYGSDIELSDPEPFMQSMSRYEKKVAVGVNSEGQKVVLFGVPAVYHMADGEECIALVAGLPAEYIQETLSLDDTEDSLVYSHIIRKNGSYVIRSGPAFRENYFDRLRATFDDLSGVNADKYVSELAAAMEANRDYSAILEFGQERRHLYCTKLAYSEWYLITIMPYSTLDDSIRNLSGNWVAAALGGCAVVLLALSLVFYGYLRLMRKQLRAVEEARQEALKANQAKSEFLSNMSHDIRTPMNAIVGMTAIATANLENTQQVQNCLKKITLSSKHLLGLINDVLDMSKIESGKMTLNIDQVSLREVMDSIVSIVQPQVKAKQQQFNVFIHDITTENVYCDSVRLNQVLLNFLSNAIKFTPDGGTIQVALHEEESPKGEEYVQIHLQVKDNGIGMSEEFRKKVFESFTREDSARVHKTEGTGLGMTIAKYIVDIMGGTIDVKSKQGEGTEFNVVLDLEKAEVQEAEMILPNWNMLVVDDDKQLCETTVDSLKSIGVDADWALCGEDAMAMVEQRHKRGDDYHILLLDWKLSDIDGIEVARRIRMQMGESIPILLISAYDWSDIEDKAREAGINGFISKPLFRSTLFYGLKKYMEGQDVFEEIVEQTSNFHGKRVLLAEDNDLNWEIAEELLSEEGLILDRAENGKICAEMFEKSEIGYYDVILMDIRMPVMTGYEATEAIRAMEREDADIPIIAMTADAFSEDIKKCMDCGMNAHISKPIDVREVTRLLEKYLK